MTAPAIPQISGLLNINKPSGVSSYWVVNQVKKVLKIKKVGHCGTLDPMATGVLLVLFGKATKLQARFMAAKKVYRAGVLFGVATDSGDITGKILRKEEALDISPDKIKEAVLAFVGEIEQIPPMFSALKHEGRRLYEIAREGGEVARKSRKITIYDIDVLKIEMPRVEVRVTCSSGTYIRTLAEDIGGRLGTVAALDSLVREEIAPFKIQDSLEGAMIGKMDREELLKHSIDANAFADEARA
ncbi:MAG TPA: tRNA pseudouridine(55) synthase TruB [Elusimicrobia bacterium]|nr:MAG: tRNA pseudouridine(55) synthase TruB [Elusimicrobia bacterium RIFOXYA12_FULL_49_49]OGS08179.1 MAG: tRNA pseudouridine(55) synthase TruB [Elusimicrobia bacterium RIFOXYA1_FULL_47_7]OGS11247.1 MAG: tRNA pseudouridine(55) synthase TruB [Elusimicrobia bacterium RIFOXYB1_FULL_48_9]OGS15644.1 MAG: tRNA pseudouridine(55) synthase TruB [Elusimicrobia bacterium RIFOXYA2_FULL_47_53]OGS26800.1 MAG: tRNA pseudouridine(55) synthase TruB [Elusimicrobia bacterium RIFOXYB12_FULL_50_12]OGS30743.1 MAG: 